MPDEFSKHEEAAVASFHKDGDTTGLMSLADHAAEEGDELYATLLRFVGHPPAAAENMARGDHEPCRFFFTQTRGSHRERLSRSARLAFAEAQAMTRELSVITNTNPPDHWVCVLQERKGTGPKWWHLDSLWGIEVSGVPFPTPGFWDRNTEIPYGPAPYCRRTN